MRTRELRGWLTRVDDHNAADPDWHWELVLDLGWAGAQGIDVNLALPAGNLLANGIEDPGSALRAKCGIPQIHVEVCGWPIRNQPARREPPDWHVVDVFGDNSQIKWPFDPRAPGGTHLTRAAHPLNTLADAQYVRIHGSLVTDNAHIDTPNDPVHTELRELWRTGANPKARDDANDISRYLEIHPPDHIEFVKQPPPPETIRMVAVAAPGTWPWRSAPQSTLDLTIPAPPRLSENVELHVQEFVGPETQLDMIVRGNSGRTGASISVDKQGVRLSVTVSGRRSLSGGSPGRFKALYRVYWLPLPAARFAALWEQGPGPRQDARHGLTSQQYQQAFASLAGQGYRLVTVTGYAG